ncbi:MAG TPA: carboxylesterase/lipase family protein, partial [Blastocatellia bacterium]|nr:carboxylesterase/lipase family protein [Blastocatellia bacterium]
SKTEHSANSTAYPITFNRKTGGRRLVMGIALASLLSVMWAPPGLGAKATPDGVVKLDSGLISGDLGASGKDVRVFKGIPYAAPPVDDLRWKAPQPVKPWIGIRPCNEFGPAEPQLNTLEMVYGAKLSRTSEDCLYLNVYAPAKLSGKFPVMVWIHGGGFTLGEGATYDGENLARQGAVVVTINYRLGVFGFMGHPALTKESGHASSGNYGLLDQIAALHWVKRNIAGFGGDPGRVTIFGESAGGASVVYLMVSPLARGLFQRAIVESGAILGRENSLGDLEKYGERFANQVGAGSDGLASLRKMSAEELFKKSTAFSQAGLGRGVSFRPIVDGWVVPEEPASVFQAGRQSNVPLMIGCNADEGSLFVRLVNYKTLDDYEKAARTNYPNPDAVLALYKASNVTEARAATSRAFTDGMAAGSVLLARLNSKTNPNTYLYHFTRVGNDPRFAGMGAYHASEIPYVFSGGAAMPHFDATDLALGRAISRYWVQFAAKGDPNQPGLIEWPKLAPAADRYLELGNEIKPAVEMVPKSVMEVFGTVPGDARASR